MANHKSAIKRIKSDATKNMYNKYVHKTTRNAIKKLKNSPSNIEDRNKVFSMIDKLVKKNILHKNKAANLKSKLSQLKLEAAPDVKKTPKKSSIKNNKKEEKEVSNK
tara:strand:- start:646 stop:966 length:321 start_codon:yes stop_codon:yes gene_type:complete